MKKMTPKIASTFFYFLLMLLFSISTVGQKPFCTQDPIPNTQTDLRTDPKYDLNACPADDIVIIGSSLEKIGDPCNSCIAGTQITASLKITIHHKTESGNRFLGVFADMKQTAPNGTESICRIARCAGAVKKASEEGPSEQQILDLGLVTFNCGNALELNRILTAWTAANGACPITSDGNSNPTGKYCYTLSTSIPITPPFNATLTAACGIGNTGNINLTVSGGSGNYTYSWSNSATTEDLTNVPLGDYTVTVTDKIKKDADGNPCKVIQSITFNGPCCVAPIITCPADIEIECDDQTTSTGTAQSIKGCGQVNISQIDEVITAQLICPVVKVINRTWTATDEKGQSSSCVQVITIKDTKAPSLTGQLPTGGAQGSICKAKAPVAPSVKSIADLYTDNCSVVTAILDPTSGVSGTDCSWTATYIYHITDDCGNQTLADAIIVYTGGDVTPPSLTGQLPTGGAQGSICKAKAPVAPSVKSIADLYTDNCSMVTATLDQTSGVTGTDCSWTATYTYHITDDCGNKTLADAIIVYTGGDVTPPSLTGQLPKGGAQGSICKAKAPVAPSVKSIADLYTDNCSMVTATLDQTSRVTGTDCSWTATYTYHITDDCGNQTLADAIIVYTGGDKSAPTFQNMPINPSVSCDNYKTWAATEWNKWTSKPTATDNCGTANVTYVSRTNAVCSNTAPSFTITWSVTDACNNSTSTTQTVTINTTALSLAVDTKEPLCQVGRGGKVTLNVVGGCAPYTYKYSCGNSSVSLATNVLTGAANGTYTFTVTDALGCTATTTATLNCSYPNVCTYSQGAYGQPGGMINGKTTCDQLTALLATPLIVGTGRTLSLASAECVDYVLPCSGTAAALSASFTCADCCTSTCACSSCSQLPLTNNSLYKNTLLGQTIALSLSVRLNVALGDLTLGEICGISIPSGFSNSTTVNKLIEYLNAGLGGSKTYNLGTLTNIAGSIITAYDGCRNPCITTPACQPVQPIVNQGGQVGTTSGNVKSLNKIADFKVFPVPSDGVVNLDMEEYRNDDIEIKIFNTMSQLVYTQKIQELQQGILSINLSNLANGAYIISVKAESQATLSKVMIINK